MYWVYTKVNQLVNGEITSSRDINFRRLQPGMWLDDKVLNEYGSLLQCALDPQAERFLFLLSYFVKTYHEHGFEKVKKWHKKVCWQVDLVFGRFCGLMLFWPGCIPISVWKYPTCVLPNTWANWCWKGTSLGHWMYRLSSPTCDLFQFSFCPTWLWYILLGAHH